ncbi:TolB family protein [Larkinella soli]|uniref:TolB family protein n=1 Tax=Larkinella soli TaxID=1770527 RepID=UPI000FFCB164|nr:PD40 domain-containing protein [Larkinella soli]
MKPLFLFGYLMVLLGLTSCERWGLSGYKYNQGSFPDRPVNLGEINSADDDYNSDIPFYGEVVPLIFSSKRGNRSDFNLVSENFNYSFDRKTGRFTLDNRPYGGLDILGEQAPVHWLPNLVNSEGNELGPYLRSYDHELIVDGWGKHYGEYLMMFAGDRTGNMDIYFTHNFQETPVAPTAGGNRAGNKLFSKVVPLPFLNSEADDAYPTFSREYDAIYFTSNRQGSFDIYRATLPGIPVTELHHRLPALKTASVERVTELSSASNDKCPYILGDLMVFTSNRPGGLGGYDLYYSRFADGKWSEPVNFGPSVNTPYDEYRPILREPPNYKQRLLLFSSNRPGGKGGFDLYLVGVPK